MWLRHVCRLAVGAYDDMLSPRRQVERHADSFSARADDNGFAIPRLVPVAVGAYVRSLPIAVGQSGNIRPEIFYSNREKQSPCCESATFLEREIEALRVEVLNRDDSIVQQRCAELLGVCTALAAEIRRPDTLGAKDSVDAASLPVTRIARIDQDHIV